MKKIILIAFLFSFFVVRSQENIPLYDGYGFEIKTSAELVLLDSKYKRVDIIYFDSDLQNHVKWNGTAFAPFSSGSWDHTITQNIVTDGTPHHIGTFANPIGPLITNGLVVTSGSISIGTVPGNPGGGQEGDFLANGTTNKPEYYNGTSWVGFLLQSDLIDEDDMSSDSDTRPPSQQSVKAYVDTEIASGGNFQEDLNIVVVTENGVVTGAGDQKANIEALIADNTELWFPNGVYNLSGILDVGNVTNFKISGNRGARFVFSSQMGIQQTGAWDNVKIEGISIESTNTTTTSGGGDSLIYMDNQQCDDVLIKNVYLTAPNGSINGIKIRQEGATTANNVVIDGVFVENIGRMGFEYQNHVTVSGNDISRASGVVVKNSRFVNPGQQEFSMGTSFSGPMENLKVLNNYFQGCSNRAMEFLATQGAEVRGNYGVGNNDFFVFTNNAVVSALSNTNIVFSENTSMGLGTGGTDNKDGGTFRDVQGLIAHGNKIYDITGGIYLDNTDNVYWSDNIVDVHSYGALVTQNGPSNINMLGGRFKNTKTGNGLIRVNSDSPQWSMTDVDFFTADAAQIHVRFGGGATIGPELSNIDEYHGTVYSETHGGGGSGTADVLSNIATNTIVGRNDAGSGDSEELAPAEVKTLLALDNLDNTSDADKPVSTAQQIALDLKANDNNVVHLSGDEERTGRLIHKHTSGITDLYMYNDNGSQVFSAVNNGLYRRGIRFYEDTSGYRYSFVDTLGQVTAHVIDFLDILPIPTTSPRVDISGRLKIDPAMTDNQAVTMGQMNDSIAAGSGGSDDQTLAEVLTEGNQANTDIDMNTNDIHSVVNLTAANITATLLLDLNGYLDFSVTDVVPPTNEGNIYADNSENRLKYHDGISYKKVLLEGDVAGSLGDVVGPVSATDNAIARYDAATGKLIQDSPVTINDSGDILNIRGLFLTPLTGFIAATEGAILYDDPSDRLVIRTTTVSDTLAYTKDVPLDAGELLYDNTTSSLTATDTQAAIDENAAAIASGGSTTVSTNTSFVSIASDIEFTDSNVKGPQQQSITNAVSGTRTITLGNLITENKWATIMPPANTTDSVNVVVEAGYTLVGKKQDGTFLDGSEGGITFKGFEPLAFVKRDATNYWVQGIFDGYSNASFPNVYPDSFAGNADFPNATSIAWTTSSGATPVLVSGPPNHVQFDNTGGSVFNFVYERLDVNTGFPTLVAGDNYRLTGEVRIIGAGATRVRLQLHQSSGNTQWNAPNLSDTTNWQSVDLLHTLNNNTEQFILYMYGDVDYEFRNIRLLHEGQ